MNSKTILDNKYYTFNAIDKTITFTANIQSQNEIVLITNINNGNQIIYNFACPEYGGVYSNHILTLVYDTTNMSNNDLLMVIILDEDKKEKYLKNIFDEIRVTNELLIELIKNKIK